MRDVAAYGRFFASDCYARMGVDEDDVARWFSRLYQLSKPVDRSKNARKRGATLLTTSRPESFHLHLFHRLARGIGVSGVTVKDFRRFHDRLRKRRVRVNRFG